MSTEQVFLAILTLMCSVIGALLGALYKNFNNKLDETKDEFAKQRKELMRIDDILFEDIKEAKDFGQGIKTNYLERFNTLSTHFNTTFNTMQTAFNLSIATMQNDFNDKFIKLNDNINKTRHDMRDLMNSEFGLLNMNKQDKTECTNHKNEMKEIEKRLSGQWERSVGHITKAIERLEEKLDAKSN